MKYLIFIIIITTIVAISLECNKPAYYYLSNSTLYLYLGGKPKYSYPKCQFISLPFYKAPSSTTPLTQKGKLLQNHIAGYKQYLEKIKITTETSRIDDGTLKDRISLGVNDSGYILDSIKKYKVNKHEHAYDLLFEHKINEWIANWEKEHNWKLSYYGEI